MSVEDETDSLLLSLIEKEIPDGRKALHESHKNLADLSEYCRQNYINSADATKFLEDTKAYASQSLASVAYQIHSLAVNMLQMMDQQVIQLDKMSSHANNIGLTVDIHKEKVARREIGVLTSSKNFSRSHKIVAPPQQEKPKSYKREEINFCSLDHIGHGVKSSQETQNQRRLSTASSTGSFKAASSVTSGSQGSIPTSISQQIYQSISTPPTERITQPVRPPVAPVAPIVTKIPAVPSSPAPPPPTISGGPPQHVPKAPPTSYSDSAMPPPPIFVPEPDYDGKLHPTATSTPRKLSDSIETENSSIFGPKDFSPKIKDILMSKRTSINLGDSVKVYKRNSSISVSPLISPRSLPLMSGKAIDTQPVHQNVVFQSSLPLTPQYQLSPLPSPAPPPPPPPPFFQLTLPQNILPEPTTISPELIKSCSAATSISNTSTHSTELLASLNPVLKSLSVFAPPLPERNDSLSHSASPALFDFPTPISLEFSSTSSPRPPSPRSHQPFPTCFLLPVVAMEPLSSLHLSSPVYPPPLPERIDSLSHSASSLTSDFPAPISPDFPPAPPFSKTPSPPPPAPSSQPHVSQVPSITEFPHPPAFLSPSPSPPPLPPGLENQFLTDTFPPPYHIPLSASSTIYKNSLNQNQEHSYENDLPFINNKKEVYISVNKVVYPSDFPPPPSILFQDSTSFKTQSPVEDCFLDNHLPPPPVEDIYQSPPNNSLVDDLPAPPSNFYDQLPAHDIVLTPPPTISLNVPEVYEEKVVAIYDYEKLRDDELQLTEGDVIYVIKKNDDGWYEGIKDGVQGLFPGNYVYPVS